MSKYTFLAQRIYAIFITVNFLHIYSVLFFACYTLNRKYIHIHLPLVSAYTEQIRFLFFLPSF